MIHDSWILSPYTRIAPPATSSLAPGREQPAIPDDAYVSGGLHASDLYAGPAATTPQEHRAPAEGTRVAAIEVSGSIAGSVLGPVGSPLAQLVAGLPPTLGRTIEGAELDAREKKLDQRLQELESQLNALAATQQEADAHAFDGVEKERAAAEKGIAERQAAIDQQRGTMTLSSMWRTAQMNAEEASLAEKARNQDQVAHQVAEQRRADQESALESKLQQRKTALETRGQALDDRQASLDQRAREMGPLVEHETEMRLERTSAALQESLAQRKATVDGLEATYNRDEAALEARKGNVRDLATREADRLQGLLEEELTRGLYAVDDGLRREFDARRDEFTQAYNARERRLAEELRSREAALRAPLSDDANRVNQLTSQAQSLRSEVASWESNISSTRARANEQTTKANQIVSNLEYDRTQLANAIWAAQNETQALDGQMRNERYELQNTFGTVRNTRGEVERARGHIAHLQQHNAQMQSEIQNLRWKL